MTREELRENLWPETFVEFDHGLNKAVSKIWDALGDSAENPRFIETIARRGYRFLAEVVVVPHELRQAAAGDVATVGDLGPAYVAKAGTSSKRPHGAFTWRVLVLGVALVIVAALSWVFYPWRHISPTIRSSLLHGDKRSQPVRQDAGRPGREVVRHGAVGPDALFEMISAGVEGINLHLRSSYINAPFHLGSTGLAPAPSCTGGSVRPDAGGRRAVSGRTPRWC